MAVKIKLDEFFSIESDKYNGWVLIEKRYIDAIDKETRKPNGEKSIKTEKIYLPKLESILENYLNQTQKKCDTLERILTETKRVKEVIKSIKL